MLLLLVMLANGLVLAREPGLAGVPGVTALSQLRPFGASINLSAPFPFVLALRLLLFGVHVLVGPPCVPAVTAFFCKFATLLGK